MSQGLQISASRCFLRRMTLVLGCIPLLASVGLAQGIVTSDPTPALRLSPESPAAGSQAEIGLALTEAFPHDVRGTLRLAFTPDAVKPADDPAIQFATGCRQVTFVIAANTLEAETGRVQVPLSSKLTIPRQAPVIQNLLLDTTNGLEARLTLSSTPREVNQVILQFVTQPPVKLDCGSVAGCVTSRGAMAFDVKSLFDRWYAGDKTFGSVSTLRFPFSIQGSVQGSIVFTLRNGHGLSNSMSFPLPGPR